MQILQTPNERNNIDDYEDSGHTVAKENVEDVVVSTTPTPEPHVHSSIKTALTLSTTLMVSFFSLLIFSFAYMAGNSSCSIYLLFASLIHVPHGI